MKLLSEPPLRGATRPDIVLLAIITMMGTMAMHMVIPALPAIAADLHQSPGVTQMTVTLFLLGLAAGQLIYGPLSDRFGRRPVLLGGLALYVLASVVAATAASIGALLTARVFQALGGCSGLVLGRAMMRDGSSSEKAAGSLAVLNTAMSVGVALAPAIGGYVALWGGWRAPFVLLAVLGASTLIMAALTLPETHRQRTALPGIRAMLGSYAALWRLPVFRGYALTACGASTSMFAFFAASPFIFMNLLNRTAEEVGLYYLLVAAGISAGSLAASGLARRFGLRNLATVGNVSQLLAGLALLGLHVGGYLSVVNLIGVVMLFGVANGLTSPMALGGAVSADPRLIGSASGLYGFMQMMYGVLCTGMVGLFPGSPVLAVAVIFVVSALLGRWGLSHAAKGTLAP